MQLSFGEMKLNEMNVVSIKGFGFKKGIEFLCKIEVIGPNRNCYLIEGDLDYFFKGF